jgi:hypothetical protein
VCYSFLVATAKPKEPIMASFKVHTLHGAERKPRSKRFADYDTAYAWAKANDPDADSSLVPNGGDDFIGHPRYEAGLFWFGNRYAVITKEK